MTPESFNPRPPFRAGATQHRLAEELGVERFQSSPALSSGRYSTTRKPSTTDDLWSFLREPRKTLRYSDTTLPSHSLNVLLAQ
ncbi:hypothetical protein COMA2_120044 [Candidatus Nitrospira nitrificans]|uniref:Uncharacterized protein n=1 Tax=Candidatus Nitrospira nitrificans TaxID=1742973 RepID=A0A0S4L8B6_9BACT|nr:hypothetical protein COMA2_120044 [Candidatus Nitrospira nitrificans]